MLAAMKFHGGVTHEGKLHRLCLATLRTVMLVVSALVRLRCAGKEVQLAIYAEHKDLSRVDYAMESLKAAMKWDEDTFGAHSPSLELLCCSVANFGFGRL